MKLRIISGSLLILMFMTSSCKKETKSDVVEAWSSSNPFYAESTLPYFTADFDKIKDSDIKPAILEGMRQHLEEINQIANNTEEASFENTFVALEKSGQLFKRSRRVFNLLTGANTNEELQEAEEELSPKFAAHSDEIYLNAKLFERIKTIYGKRNDLNLDSESIKLVEKYFEDFELAGANLSEESKQKLKKLNEEEASLSTQFSNQLLKATNEGGIKTDIKSLDGLAENEIASLKQEGGIYTISLQNTTQQPFLQSLKNRDLREKLFKASWSRTEKGDENDTRKTFLRIAKIRAEKAKLMGYKTYAEWSLKNQMAQKVSNVEDFFAQLVPAATAKAMAENDDIQKVIDAQQGGFKNEAWDWNFYAEQVRKAKYDLDENNIKPYLQARRVLEDGVFFAAKELYGITFKERKDLPVYHPEVIVYEVFDHDNSPMALFYMDFFKRDSKRGGAWMSNIVGQSKLLNTKPVIYNVCNFNKPAEGQPALISFDDVTTLFHEFGHTLHGLFADQTYPSLSGTSVARDFVEFPSQFNEHWALDPKVIKNYAVHYQTDESMPQALIDKIKNAATFNQGYALTELLAAASLDMAWHNVTTETAPTDADLFETTSLTDRKLNLAQVPPRYRSSYFLHIWGHGYAAAYYAYLWTDMLNYDAVDWIENNGGLTRENGQKYRDEILSRGNTLDYNQMYKNLTGRAPRIQPMLKARGLN